MKSLRTPVLRRGFVFIGLLIVLIIIMVLTGMYFARGPAGPAPGSGRPPIEDARVTACQAGRHALEGEISMWSTEHSGEKVSLEALKAAGVKTDFCPDHGVITLGDNGRVYCSKHKPAPAASGLK